METNDVQRMNDDRISLSSDLIEKAETLVGSSAAQLTEAIKSTLLPEEDGEYSIDDIDEALERDTYCDAISVDNTKSPDKTAKENLPVLETDIDDSNTYTDAISAKLSPELSKKPFPPYSKIDKGGSSQEPIANNIKGENSEEAQLEGEKSESKSVSKEDNKESDESESPNVLKIVESWENNTNSSCQESPRSNSDSSQTSPRMGTLEGEIYPPWKEPSFHLNPQPLPGMSQSNVYSLARNVNLSFESVGSKSPPADSVYEEVGNPILSSLKSNQEDEPASGEKKPYKYDPPWTDHYPQITAKGNNSTLNPEKGMDLSSDPITGECLYDTPLEEKSGSYDHLTWKGPDGTKKNKTKSENMYGVQSGKKLLNSTEAGQPKYKKKGVGKTPGLPFVEKHPDFQGSGRYDEVADDQESFYDSVGLREHKDNQREVSDPRSSTIDSTFSWGSEFSDESSGEERPEYPDKPLPPIPDRTTKDLESPRSEEESPVKPVNINPEKHPPPLLPEAPEGLTKEQEKKRHVIENIIRSEKSYIDSLSRIIKDYKTALLFTFTLDRNCIRIVFSKAEEILHHHKMFQIELAESVSKWYTEEKIGSIFTALFSRSMVVDVYSTYINSFAMAMEEIKAAQTAKPALDEFLNNTAKKSIDRLSIFGLMVKPIQRYPQFIMLIKDLLKYTPHHHHDRCYLQRALTDLENVTHMLNERKRESEELFQAKKLQKTLNIKVIGEKQQRLIRQDDMDEMQSHGAPQKTRKLYLLDNCVICCSTQQGPRVKWMKPLSEIELKDTAITPDMQSVIKANPNKFSIHTAVMEYKEDDMFNLHRDIGDMMHDMTVLGQISTLINSLKLSYEGLTEERAHEAITDLQQKIQIKDQQLQVINSSTITLQDIKGHGRYIFQTSTPEVKQEWCIDLIMAKLSIDPLNNPSWEMCSISGQQAKTIHQPAMYVRSMSVDMPKHFTKVKCAVPVFLSSGGVSNDISMQHLWVVTTSEVRAQVSLVSVHTTRLALIESFQAADTEIITVETVPAISMIDQDQVFIEDTVWMSTEKCEILVYSLLDENGVRTFTAGPRKPRSKFYCHGIAVAIRYADDRVFVGLRNGTLVIYDRNDTDGCWMVESPNIVQVGCDEPISCIVAIEDEIWVACGDTIFIIPVDENEFEETLECDGNATISDMVRSGCGLWMSFKNKSYVRLYHIETKENLQEINLGSTIERMMSECKYQPEEKDARNTVVTSLMASRGLLWVGTNLGIVCSLPLPRLRDGVPLINSRPNISFHAHNGPVQFLIPIYCGTVNLWQRAQGLNSNESMAWRGNASSVRGRRSSKSPERSSKSPELDKCNKSDMDKNEETSQSIPRKEQSVIENRLSRSLECLADSSSKIELSKSQNMEKKQQKALTLRTELMQKFANRNMATPDTGNRADENEITMYYGDLMDNEEVKETSVCKDGSPPRDSVKSKEDLVKDRLSSSPRQNNKSASKRDCDRTNSTIRKRIKGIGRSLMNRTSSVRYQGDEKSSAVYETLRKRTCNAVVVVSGGDGYIDWRSAVQTNQTRSTEASLMLWMYKF